MKKKKSFQKRKKKREQRKIELEAKQALLEGRFFFSGRGPIFTIVPIHYPLHLLSRCYCLF